MHRGCTTIVLPQWLVGHGQCEQQAALGAEHWLCERAAGMWSLARKRRSVCFLILSHLPIPPRVPCQALQERCCVTAICHSDPVSLQVEWHCSHSCSSGVSLCSAGINPGIPTCLIYKGCKQVGIGVTPTAA